MSGCWPGLIRMLSFYKQISTGKLVTRSDNDWNIHIIICSGQYILLSKRPYDGHADPFTTGLYLVFQTFHRGVRKLKLITNTKFYRELRCSCCSLVALRLRSPPPKI